MTKRKYSVIVFDLGNVLIPFNYDIVVNKMNEIEAGLGDHFYKMYRENYQVHQQHERWEISTEKFLDIMSEWTKNKIGKVEFCEIYSSLFTVNEDVVSLLPRLKENYKLVLLSNTNYVHQKFGWERYSFLEYFDNLILSHEVGALKPEKLIYKAVESATNIPSHEHIFIDDIPQYTEGAKNAGWDAIHFTGYESLVQEFKVREILN